MIYENKFYSGKTPRIIVDNEFIEREKFKLISFEEVENFYKKNKKNDSFDFGSEIYFDHMDTNILIKMNVFTKESLEKLKTKQRTRPDLEETVQDMLDYLVFAWGKISDERGLSCGRNVFKLKAFFNLLSRPDLEKIVDEDYNDYGREYCLKLFKTLGLYNPLLMQYSEIDTIKASSLKIKED